MAGIETNAGKANRQRKESLAALREQRKQDVPRIGAELAEQRRLNTLSRLDRDRQKREQGN